MLINFIASLIILSFAFRVIIILAGWPVKFLITIFFTPLTLGRMDKANFWSTMITPFFFGALYGIFIAVVTMELISSSVKGEGQTTYLVCGVIAVLFSLLSYSAGLRAKVGGGFLSSGESVPEDRAYKIASIASLLLGLAGFALIFFYPEYISFMPGGKTAFAWVFKLADWINSFTAVKIILAVGIAGYIIFATIRTIYRFSLLGGVGLRRLWGAVVSKIKMSF